MKTLYTKGPWAVKQVPTQAGIAFKVNEPDKMDEGHGLIACIYSDDTSLNKRPRIESYSNALLIAAAPEMAEMLLSMFAHVSHGGPTRADAEVLLRKAGVL